MNHFERLAMIGELEKEAINLQSVAAARERVREVKELAVSVAIYAAAFVAVKEILTRNEGRLEVMDSGVAEYAASIEGLSYADQRWGRVYRVLTYKR